MWLRISFSMCGFHAAVVGWLFPGSGGELIEFVVARKARTWPWQGWRSIGVELDPVEQDDPPPPQSCLWSIPIVQCGAVSQRVAMECNTTVPMRVILIYT